MRGFAILASLFVLVLLLAVLEFRFRYLHPEGQRALDLMEAVYAVFTLLFFGGGYPWPEDPLARVLFFLVPMLGVFVVGQGLIGLASAMLNRERWQIAVASTYADHVIVCGLGRVGFRVVEWLTRLGEPVVLIESSGDHPLLDQVRSLSVPVIAADARRPEILEQAGLEKASSIVPCTNDDLINLSIATAARSMRPDIRVVLRTFDDALASNLQRGFDIHFAYSTSALAAPAFAAAALRAPVDHALAFGEDEMLLTITEFVVVEESPLSGSTVGKLEQELECEVLAITRSGTSRINPPDDTALSVEDRFVVMAPVEMMSRIGRLVPPFREFDRYRDGKWKVSSESL